MTLEWTARTTILFSPLICFNFFVAFLQLFRWIFCNLRQPASVEAADAIGDWGTTAVPFPKFSRQKEEEGIQGNLDDEMLNELVKNGVN